MGDITLIEAVTYKEQDVTPQKKVLTDFLSAYQELPQQSESPNALTPQEANQLLLGLEQGKILFSVAKNELDHGIQVEFPRYRVPGHITVDIDNKPYNLPMNIEGIVLIVGKNDTLETLLNNPLARERLKEAYNRHVQIPLDSPYDTKGKESVPEIADYFYKFLRGEQWGDLPEFLANRNPGRKAGFFAYNEFIKDFNKIDLASVDAMKKLSCIVGRYTLNSARQKHILLQDPTHHAFNE